MKLQRLQIEGITRFRSAVEIDFAALGEGLIAFVGPNGAGKTTLLECSAPAALWRELPTRPDPALQNWIGPKGGFLELRFESGGHEYVSTLKYPAKGSPQAFLHVDDVAVTSGKLKDFDAAVEERFGRADAFYASAFAAQGGKGRFAALSVSDRKSIFRFYLGLARVEAIHAAAKARLARVDVARSERLGREAELLRASIPMHEGAIRTCVEQVADATSIRDAASEALRRLDADGAMSAAVSAYQRALRDVLAAEARLKELEAAAPRPPLAPAPEPELLLAELDGARATAAEMERLEDELIEARGLLDEAERVLADAAMRAAELSEVPCKGGARFAGCKFLAEARAAHDNLPGLKETAAGCEELVQIKEHALAEAPAVDADALRILDEKYRAALRARRDHDAAKLAADRAATSVAVAKDALRDARRRAMAMRKELPDPIPVVPSLDDLAAARKAAADAQAELDGAVRSEAAARAALAETRGRLDSISGEIDKDKATRADGQALALLARGFGPGGIQALEIDASGPKVSELANELVAACYGDRFTLEIKTQRELKSRDGAAEDFAVHVLDAERGRTGSLASLSGGEQVVVDEALRTALALFAVGSRAGVEIGTLWRDETPAALYGDNVARYLAMLHRARTLGGFHQVLFVGGDGAADAADAVVNVGADGTVTYHR